MMLKRHLAFFMLVNATELMPLCKVYLMSAYGAPGEDHAGPYSYCGFIKAMLKKDEAGDFLVAYLVALMWQLKVTIVEAQPMLAEVRLRHNQPLEKADLVLVYNNQDHFSAAGNCLILRGVHTFRRQLLFSFDDNSLFFNRVLRTLRIDFS